MNFTFGHSEQGEQIELGVVVPPPAPAGSPATPGFGDHRTPGFGYHPVPAEWFSHSCDYHTADLGTALPAAAPVTVTTNGVAALCRSPAGPAGCTWTHAADRSSKDPAGGAQQVTAAAAAAAAAVAGHLRPDPAELAEHPAAVQRWRRELPADAKRWSALKTGSCPSPLVVPRGETWVLDASMDCNGVVSGEAAPRADWGWDSLDKR